MRIPNAVHESRPWRIREIAPDFIVEDVWALPVHGTAADFDSLIEMTASFRPDSLESRPTRVLWGLRDQLGKWMSLGRISKPAAGGSRKLPIPGTRETSLTERLPDDLRGTVADLDFGALPFVPVFKTGDEFAAELSNRTVHAVLHLAWVDQGDDRFEGQMAVYVKPRGAFGRAYMAAIKPFRYAIVYPALMRQIERMWSARERREPRRARVT